MAMFGDNSMTIVIDAKNKTDKVFAKIQKDMQTFKGRMDKMKPTFQKMSAVGGVAFTGLAIGVGKFAKEAGRFESVSDAWNGMAKDFGVGSEEIIERVKEATRGTVSNMDIIQKAVKAGSLIGKESMGDFGANFTRMATLAKKASRATGQDVEFMFESLVTGVGRASPMILDNLGIVLKTGVVYSDYAESLGKTANELTIVEQKTAILNAVLEQGEEKYRNVAVSSGGLSGAIQKQNAEWADLKVTIGTTVMPVLNDLLRKITPIVEIVIKWIKENPKLTKTIIIATAGLTALVAVIGLLGLALPAIISGFTLLTGPIGLVIVVIGSLIFFVKKIIDNWWALEVAGAIIWEKIKDTVGSAVDWIGKKVEKAINLWNKMKSIVSKPIKATGDFASGVFGKAKSALGFQHGGIVPGVPSQAVPIMAHGGEKIIPRSKVGGGGRATIITNINNPIVRSDDDLERIENQIERILRGVILNNNIEA